MVDAGHVFETVVVNGYNVENQTLWQYGSGQKKQDIEQRN